MNDDKDRKRRANDRGIVMRNAAKRGGLVERRVWLARGAEEADFDVRIAPMGPHVRGLAEALDHCGIRPLARRVASKLPEVPKPAESPPSPAPIGAPPIEYPKPAPPTAHAAPKEAIKTLSHDDKEKQLRLIDDNQIP